MAIKSLSECDGCRADFHDGDEAYCLNCIDAKDKEIEGLEQKLGRQDEEINDLESEIQTLKGQVEELENLSEK